MKIRQRPDGRWYMEHGGAEAPFTVLCRGEDKFDLFDHDDADIVNPLVEGGDAATCEAAALQHGGLPKRSFFGALPTVREFADAATRLSAALRGGRN